MNLPYPRLTFAAAFLLAGLLAPRGAAASTTLTGGNLGNQTWTPAGSPYIVEGDITVQAGATLTIQAGTDVQFVNGDMQKAGLDTTRTELTDNGSLAIAGTTANPVTFEMQQGQSGTWYGVVIAGSAAAATVTNASFAGYYQYAITSAMTGATLSVTRTAIWGNGNGGINITNGSVTLDSITVMPSTGAATLSEGIAIAGQTSATTYNASLTNALIVDASYGIFVGNTVVVNMSSLTIDHCATGIYLAGSGASVTVSNTIVTNSAGTGVAATSFGPLTMSYSDVWNCATNLSNVKDGGGNISANPQYVGTGEYYHLQPSSVCIDTGTSTGAPDHDLDGTPRPLDGDGLNGPQYDMGAYEYNPNPGAGGAGGATASGTGGAAGTSGAAGATGGGGSGAAGTSGVGGAAGISGAAGTTGTAGAIGTGGATGSTGAGGLGSGGATGAAGSSGAGGALAGAGGAAGGAAGSPGTAGSTSGHGGAEGGVPDGGTTTGGSSGGGCGCETGGRPTSAWGLALIGTALILRRRRPGRA